MSDAARVGRARGPDAADRGDHVTGQQRAGERHRHRHRRRGRQRRRRRRAVLRRRRRDRASRTRAAPYALQWDTRTVAERRAHARRRALATLPATRRSPPPVTVNVANTNFFQNEILATGFNLPTRIEVPARRPHAGRGARGHDQGAAAALHAARSDAVPAAHQRRLGRRAAGHLRHRARSELRDQPLLLRLLHARYAEPRPPVALHRQRHPHRHGRRAASSCSTRIPQDANAEHHGGAINFGNDGKIYFTTGEHFNAAEAQELTNPRGKIHRINPDGTVPTDNPFYDGAGPNWDSIWAYGLRNPYRAYYDAPTGRLFIGDVGGNDYSTAEEEVDIGAARRQLRLAELRGQLPGAVHQPALLLCAQRARRGASPAASSTTAPQFPAALPGQLLLRRLHAELDPPADASTPTATSPASSTSSRPTARSTVRTATSST